MDKEVQRGGEVLDQERIENEDELTTGVDQLLELLKTQEKIPLEEAAKDLGVSLDVVQSWVDFLVEEQIVGIEYKFTKPYIYLNQPESQKEAQSVEESQSLESLKEDFMQKAEKKDIPDKNIRSLWRNHVQQALESKKEFFMQHASKRGLENTEALWKEYKEKLLGA